MGRALQAHPSKEVAAWPLTTRLSKKIRHESEIQHALDLTRLIVLRTSERLAARG